MNRINEPAKLGLTDLWMLAAIILWALNFSLIKIALREFSPLGFNGIRLVYASGVLFLFLAARGEKLKIHKGDVKKLLVLGLLGNTAYQLCFIHGINWTTASNSSIIIAMAPVTIALLSNLVKHERLSFIAWTGISISFLGFYLVITSRSGGFEFSWQYLRGDLLIFLGNIFWAFYTVFSKPMLSRYSPLKLTAWTMALGTVFFIPFAFKDTLHLPWQEISPGAWGALAYSGFFALSVCYVIWYSSVKRVGNSRTAIYDNLMPVLTVIFAYFMLGERITLIQGAGALIIFTGVYLARAEGRWFGRMKKIFY